MDSRLLAPSPVLRRQTRRLRKALSLQQLDWSQWRQRLPEEADRCLLRGLTLALGHHRLQHITMAARRASSSTCLISEPTKETSRTFCTSSGMARVGRRLLRLKCEPL